MPAQVVAESASIIVIKDISPKSSIHYLIIPKVHYKDLQSVPAAPECATICDLMAMGRTVSSQTPGAEEYRLVINNGYKAGQRVFHLHMHFLAGSSMAEF